MSLIVWSLEDVEKYMQLKEKIGISEVQEDVVPCMYLEQVKINRKIERETNKSYTKKHDKLFRDTLDDKTEVVKFIEYFINSKSTLKATEIEKYNRNFITKDYKERQSDIVYKIKDKNVFLIIEHQSKVDYSMPFRFEEYGFETMKSAIDRSKLKNKNYNLPRIIPILIYTGENGWKVSNRMQEEQYEEIEEGGLQLEYNIIDINDYTKEELLEKDSIVAVAMAIEKCKNDNEIERATERLVEISTTENRKELAIRIVTNILKPTLDRINPNITEEVLQKLKESEVKESMRPLDVRIQEGNEILRNKIRSEAFEEGRMEGIAEGEKLGERRGKRHGKKEGIISIAANMIKAKFDSDIILKMTGLKQDELEKLAKEIN